MRPRTTLETPESPGLTREDEYENLMDSCKFAYKMLRDEFSVRDGLRAPARVERAMAALRSIISE